jgi:hypothetical protein
MQANSPKAHDEVAQEKQKHLSNISLIAALAADDKI